VVITVVVIVSLPPSACHVLPCEYDLPNECGQEGDFTATRVITGALGIVIAIALVFISSIRDVDDRRYGPSAPPGPHLGAHSPLLAM
jgi:hypothetical protein